MRLKIVELINFLLYNYQSISNKIYHVKVYDEIIKNTIKLNTLWFIINSI